MNSSDTTAALASNESKKRTRHAWEPAETQFVLNNYNFFKDEIGTGKTFKTQKALWEWIASEMPGAINSNKTGYQIGQHFQNINKKSAGKGNFVQKESAISSPVIGSVINVDQTSVISAPVISLNDVQEKTDGQSVEPHIDGACDEEEPFIISVSTPLLGGLNSQNKNSTDKNLDQNGGQSNISVSTQFGSSQSNDFPRFDIPSRATNIGVATVYGMPSNRVIPAPPVHSTNNRILFTFTSAPIRLPTSSNIRSISSNAGTVSPATTSASVCWTVDETKCLLDEYYCYMDEVGPRKLFRTKKVMWDTLARKLNSIFKTNKTGCNLEERIKELIERKKGAVNHNRVSGQARMLIEYEEELSKISSLDDSIEPEVLRGVKNVQYKKPPDAKQKTVDVGDPTTKQQTKKPRWDRPNKKGILNTLSNTMMSIEQRRTEREVAKEDRRAEKHEQVMEILRSLKKD